MGTHTTPEMQAAIERLNALPESDQAHIAPRINEYLTRLELLREAIREGDDSGDAAPLDLDAVLAEARQTGDRASSQ
jgi:hypothetical protein